MIDGILDYLGACILGQAKYRRSRYKHAKRIARRHGFEVYKPHLIWLQDADYQRAKSETELRKIIGIPNDRCYMLLDLARSSRSVAGDIAECGVRHGKSSLFILNGFGAESTKRFEVFDSFEGLSAPVDSDKGAADFSVWEPGELAVQEETVLNNLRDYGDRILLHKGWIPDRFDDVKNRKFAFLHVDVDLYEPTRDSLSFFYPRMSKGGVMVCDDYGSAYCPGAKKAVDEFFVQKPERIIALPTGQSVIIKE